MISLLCGLDSGVRLLLSSAMLLCLYTYFSTDGRLTRGRAECPKTPVFVRYREGPLGWVSPAARRFPSGPSASVCGLMRRGFYRKKKTQRRTSACGLGRRTRGERYRNNGLQQGLHEAGKIVSVAYLVSRVPGVAREVQSSAFSGIHLYCGTAVGAQKPGSAVHRGL